MERRVTSVVGNQPDVLRLAGEDRRPQRDPSEQIVAHSAAMREVLELASRVARLETAVLIQGEPGVGKAGVARYVHGQSRCSQGPFVRVACGALHGSEVDDRLFGPVGWGDPTAPCRAPSLMESAHRGTLFLDEVSQLPAWAQTKLLDVLQQTDGCGPPGNQNTFPDLRLIAATTCDLKDAAARNRFHPELYYYLSAARIRVPPLRHRQEDIRALAEHFLLLAGSVLGRPPDATAWHFSVEAWECLLGYDWPGNAPELASVVARAVVLADDAEIGPACLVESLGETRPRGALETVLVPLGGSLAAMERAIVEEVIRRCRGNKAAAARTLGLHRRTLYRILKKRRPR